MRKGLKKLYSGDFNTMNQEWQPDGSVIVSLTQERKHKTYRFRVKDLYGENEEVLEHRVIPTGAPQWVKDRMEEAQHGKPED